LAKVSLYLDEVAWKRFREQVFEKHGTLRRLSDEVENLICSEDIETVIEAGAKKLGISIERGLTPTAIKKFRPKLRGAVAENLVRQMREQRHAGRLPRQ
jgi:hypothetical protein